MYIVYKHTAPNNKVYIGISGQTVEQRWRKGKGYKNTPLMQKAINKYGWDNFKHEILFDGLTKEEAEAKEIELIKFYKSNDIHYGYNIENGGRTVGTHSEATKKKIGDKNRGKIVSEEARKRMRENHADVKGKNNPQYGKKFSLERRKQMSEVRKGTRCGKDNHMYGKTHSPETRKLISERVKGTGAGAKNNRARAVVQMDLEGNVLRVFNYIGEAKQFLGIEDKGGGHISSCASGKLKTAYGYKWKYAERS